MVRSSAGRRPTATAQRLYGRFWLVLTNVFKSGHFRDSGLIPASIGPRRDQNVGAFSVWDISGWFAITKVFALIGSVPMMN